MEWVNYLVQGLFTGIGTAIGLYIYNEMIKPTMEKNKERTNNVMKDLFNPKEPPHQ